MSTSSGSRSSEGRTKHRIGLVDSRGIAGQIAALRRAVFGTVIVISKDAKETSARTRLTLATIEALQLASFPLALIRDAVGLNPLYWASTALAANSIKRIGKSSGFTLVLVGVLVTVLSFLGLAILVAYRFAASKPQGRGMLRVLRVLATLCTSVFFIPFAGILMNTLHCDSNPAWTGTGVQCGSGGFYTLAVATSLLLVVFTLFSLFLAATFVNTDPTSGSWHARIHSRVDVAVLGIKLLFTFGWAAFPELEAEPGSSASAVPLIAAGVMTAVGLAWGAVLWWYAPFIHMKMNAFAVAEAALLVWVGLAAVARLAIGPDLDPSLMVLLGGPVATIAAYYLFLQHIDKLRGLPRSDVERSLTSLELWARLRLRTLLDNGFFSQFLQARHSKATGKDDHSNGDCLRNIVIEWRQAMESANKESLVVAVADGSHSRALHGQQPPRRQLRRKASSRARLLQASAEPPESVESGSAGEEASPDEEEGFDAGRAGAGGQAQLLQTGSDRASVVMALASLDEAVEAYRRLTSNFPNSELALTTAAAFTQAYSPFHYGELLLLHKAAMLNTSLDTQYRVFRRVRELQLGSGASGHRGSGSIVDRVMVEQNVREIHRLERRSYYLTSRLWNELAANVVDLGPVERLTQSLHNTFSHLGDLYKSVLRAAPNSSSLLRGYASFLRDKQHDEDAGQEYDNKADRIEEAQSKRHRRAVRHVVYGAVSNTPMDDQDESTAVVTVSGELSNLGEVLDMSLAACRLFNFRTVQQILGTNVKELMPEPIRSCHDRYMQRFAYQQRSTIVGRPRTVFVSSSSGAVLPCWLQISEAPPDFATAAPRFTGVLEPIATSEQHLICSLPEDGLEIHAGSAGALGVLGVSPEALKAPEDDGVSAQTFFPTLSPDEEPMRLVVEVERMLIITAAHSARSRASAAESNGADATDGMATTRPPRLALDAIQQARDPQSPPIDTASGFISATATTPGRATSSGDQMQETRFREQLIAAARRAIAMASRRGQRATLPGTCTEVLEASKTHAVFAVATPHPSSRRESLIPVVRRALNGDDRVTVVVGGIQRVRRDRSFLVVRWRSVNELLRRVTRGSRRRVRRASRVMQLPSGHHVLAGATPTAQQQLVAPLVASSAPAPFDTNGMGVTSQAGAKGHDREAAVAEAKGGVGPSTSTKGGESADGSLMGSLNGDADEDDADLAGNADTDHGEGVQAGAAAVGATAMEETLPATESGMSTPEAAAHLSAMRPSAVSPVQPQFLSPSKPPAAKSVHSQVRFGDTSSAWRSARNRGPARQESPVVTGSLEAEPGGGEDSRPTRDDDAYEHSDPSDHGSQHSGSTGASEQSLRLADVLEARRTSRDPDVARVQGVLVFIGLALTLIAAGNLFWVKWSGEKLDALVVGVERSGARVLLGHRCAATILELVASSAGMHSAIFREPADAAAELATLAADLHLVHQEITVAGDVYGEQAYLAEHTKPRLLNELLLSEILSRVEASTNSSQLHHHEDEEEESHQLGDVPCHHVQDCEIAALGFIGLAATDPWLDQEQVVQFNQLDPGWVQTDTSAIVLLAPAHDDDALARKQRAFLLENVDAVAASSIMPFSHFAEYFSGMLDSIATAAINGEESGYHSGDVHNALANERCFMRAAELGLQSRGAEVSSLLPVLRLQLQVTGIAAASVLIVVNMWLVAGIMRRLSARSHAVGRLLLLIPRRACRLLAGDADTRSSRLAEQESSVEHLAPALEEAAANPDSWVGHASKRMLSAGGKPPPPQPRPHRPSGAHPPHVSETHGIAVAQPPDEAEALDSQLLAGRLLQAGLAAQQVVPLASKEEDDDDDDDDKPTDRAGGQPTRLVVRAKDWTAGRVISLRPHADSSRRSVRRSLRLMLPLLPAVVWLAILILVQGQQQRRMDALVHQAILANLLAEHVMAVRRKMLETVLAADATLRQFSASRLNDMADELVSMSSIGLFGGSLALTELHGSVLVPAIDRHTDAFDIFIDNGCIGSADPLQCGEAADGALLAGAYAGTMRLVALARKLIAALPAAADDPARPLVFGEFPTAWEHTETAWGLSGPHLWSAYQHMATVIGDELHAAVQARWQQAAWSTFASGFVYVILLIATLVWSHTLSAPLYSTTAFLARLPRAVQRGVPALRQALRDLAADPAGGVISVKFDPASTKLVKGKGFCGAGLLPGQRHHHHRGRQFSSKKAVRVAPSAQRFPLQRS